MFTIKVRSSFSSAHNLRGYKGNCEDLHGHNWQVEVVAEAEELDKMGMVADFRELKKQLNEVIGRLDHKYLNDLKYFKDINPTSEHIARYIFEEMSAKDAKPGIKKVTVWETEGCSAAYSTQ